MKSKIIIMVLVVAFIAIMGGAYFFYNHLSSQMQIDKLTVEENTGFTEENTNTEDDEQKEGGQEEGSQEEGSQEEYVLAPDFTVYDIDGNAYKLSDFRGKPIIVNFWASWCSPCKSEMPDFDLAYQEYGEEIHFLMINMTDGYQETVESAKEFIENSGYSFPVYYDTDMDAAMTYGVFSIPTTYFIDADGYVIANGRGALDMETLEQGISMITE